jgi:hypothetical protein
MAFYLRRRSELTPYFWYRSNPAPLERLSKKFEDIISLQADDAELKYIRKHFANIPLLRKKKKKLVTWTGAMAQFIYNQL